MKLLKDPALRVRGAWGSFAVCVVGWPASLVLTDEPPFLLSLSWLAIIYTALDIIATTDVRREQDAAS